MRVNIICPQALESLAREVSDEVAKVFPETELSIDVATANMTATTLSQLTIVLFGDESYDDIVCNTQQACAKINPGSPILPITGKAGRDIPPGSMARYKARHWPEERQVILNRIGSLLGLALRPGEQQVFISFRTADGRRVAELIKEHLTNLGYKPWLDEAFDGNTGEPNMPLGADVDATIETNLSQAGAVLLLDTPLASHSRWLYREVDLALGHMVPILPVVFHLSGEIAACRFRQLQSLHRKVAVEFDAEADPAVKPKDLDAIVREMEEYLKTVYQRRVVHARDLMAMFQKHCWTFTDVDGMRYRYRSELPSRSGVSNRLLSCCSFEDRIFGPAVRRFAVDVLTLAKHSHFQRHLYFYAGSPESAMSLEHIYKQEIPEANTSSIVFLNYSEAADAISRLTSGATRP